MLKSLEFYSGIGGAHYALKEANPDAEVIAAFDINTTANCIYRHNFPETNLKQCNIQSLSVEYLDKQNADLWTMSPPCQPFTRKGLKKWHDDNRSSSFLALLEKLEKMSNPPRYFFLENVLGFEKSTVHQTLIALLERIGYKCQEYILSPLQYGIPNSRPRYYLLASTLSSFESSALSTDPPSGRRDEVDEIRDYLEPSSSTDSFLDTRILEKYGKTMDIVTPSSRRSGCFTKSYGGTCILSCGSYFCEDDSLIDGQHLTEEALACLDNVRVRKLLPREVANLMCFPKKSFQQPAISTNRQMYQTLGNSINVRVVSSLLVHLLSYKL